jgi:DNA-binding protein HU-beta
MGLFYDPASVLATISRGRAAGIDFLSHSGYIFPKTVSPRAHPNFMKGTEGMAKALTKAQIVAGVADEVGITKKQAGAAIEALAQMAYKGAKNGFTVPGLGKLVLLNRKARQGRNPATGATIQIPAKRVVKFRVSKICKDAILG